MILPYRINSKTREKFLKTYTVDCVSHTLLMPNETQYCSCGQAVTSNFFVFSFTNDNTNFGMFTSGPSCGMEIVKLANLSTPSIFNPFVAGTHKSYHHSTSEETKQETSIKFTPINKEIYNLLNLYRCMTRKALDDSLLTVFKFITNNPRGNVFDSYIVRINNLLNDAVLKSNSKSLQEYFETLAGNNNKKFRKFEFPHFKAKLASMLENYE